MEKDRDANYSEKMYTNGWPYEDLTGASAPGQDLSYFRDDESKAWERKLMAPDLGLDGTSLQVSKETRSFLWKAGMVPYVSSPPLSAFQPTLAFCVQIFPSVEISGLMLVGSSST